MFEKVLVPLDGSNAAEIVLPYVEMIAGKAGAEVILVSVSESSATEADHLSRSYLKRIAANVERELKQWNGEEVTVRSAILGGKPAPEILRYADENNVGLIAMASRGSSGKGPWLLGNIASKVLRATSKPLLLVRVAASDIALQEKKLVKRILLPLDGSPVGETAIPSAEALAKALGSELVLFQVIEPEPVRPVGYGTGISYNTAQYEESRKKPALDYLDSVGKPLRERKLGVSSVVDFGSPADRIIDYAKANAIDLIASSTHGRTGIGRWVFGSITDKVLHAGDTPVLVVRAART